ncbi:hypothetical protein SLEP1_g23491 [Rubroshorea leprosula]|uniref:Uncharacterized protein n=1 Tax=Rubroshorea leprosula TaxID=152421 RepID=A0AAV5JCQ6_9ROSI|nr:hypothetical protein SLEP1_g23491 [Rubroshorea leprosula]
MGAEKYEKIAVNKGVLSDKSTGGEICKEIRSGQKLWLYSYFPALAPVSSAVPARDLLTYGFMFKNAVENKRSFEECLKFFASLSVE